MAETLVPFVASLAICQLPSDVGPCDTFKMKWFYDVRLSKCRKFWYGGCEGNKNQFDTKMECAKTCEMVRENIVFDDKKHNSAYTDQCKLDRSRGKCSNYTLKWYFDQETSICNMFWYGGCGGNENRFDTEDACKYKCVVADGTGGGTCSPGTFRCRNIQKCISNTQVCDGFNDCGDNTDEENCESAGVLVNQCAEGSSMCKTVKKCVSDSQRCDRYDDCGDGSDEEGCHGTAEFGAFFFNRCHHGSSKCKTVQKCVSDSRRCDGYDDCGDNSDEEGCSGRGGFPTNHCGIGSSMCKTVKKCVSDSQHCDGFDDCGDNSDEENCDEDGFPTNQCGTGSSMCKAVKKCIPDIRRCDGYDDCGDNSDEEGCGGGGGILTNQCGAGRSMCKTVKKCVSDSRRCDGNDDCGDNSDEEDCDGGIDRGISTNQCGAGRSMCKTVRKCVSDSRRCDGYDDCGDNSDEEECEGDTDGSLNPCGPGRTICKTKKKCLPDSRRCDGYDDCGDNSDEEGCDTDRGIPTNQCGTGRSMCKSVKKCVSDSRRCDGYDDCGDGSDEEGCDGGVDGGFPTNQCGAGRSMCKSVKKCVSDSRRCDGYDDCGDGSDEEGCDGGVDGGISTNQCGAGRSMCKTVRKCVSDSRRCDGYDDCGDNSDEEGCDGGTDGGFPINQCGAGRSMCKSLKKCVSDSRRCDGYDDCGDGSDEEGCDGGTDAGFPTNQCAEGSSMCKSVKKCVSDSRRCDGYDDCGDGSDEEGCDGGTDGGFPTNQCGAGRSMCKSVKKCVSDSRRCDGYDDCGDGSDEEGCDGGVDGGFPTNQCGAGRSMCKSVKKCVSDSRRCDGYDDCGDGSDEEGCDGGVDGGLPTNQCGAGRSMCKSVKKCVSDSRRCDGYDDCGDGSDEEGCDGGTDGGLKPCGPGRTICKTIKKCVPDSRRCDGYDDCGDNSDEEGCDGGLNPCGSGRTICKTIKKCVPDSRRCDGYDDCGDNSDEEGCSDLVNKCPRGTSFCGTVKKCVADSKRCDGRDDCGDNSDEENCDDDSSSNQCGRGRSMCKTVRKCVPDSRRCNGYDDCGDNSDEEGCLDSVNKCPQGTSFCRGIKKCVADSKRCDGHDDCGDNSDEENCDDDSNTVSIECATSQYGCCRDGQTSATGPNQKGCPGMGEECEQSEYGCCQDGVTAAFGPNNRGCKNDECHRSAYGCCPDGITKAKGADAKGCPKNGDVFDPAQCGLKQDKGGCANWEAKYYFDSKMGTCAQFWYGGCGGNANKFDNKIECDNSCVHVKGPGLCRLPKAPGLCKSNKPRYYYDYNSGECRKFMYGGCRGNTNRFHTRGECEMKCSDSTYIDSEDDDGPTTRSPHCRTSRYGCCSDGRTHATGPNYQGCTCQTSRYGCCDDGITAATGPNMHGCEEESGSEPCEETLYGCCADSINRAQGPNQEGCGDDLVITTELTGSQPPETDDPCSQDKDSRRCSELIVKWYWNKEEKRCSRFWYGGCKGSINLFDSEEACLARCKNPVPPTTEENVCELEKRTGRCRGWNIRWYFDRVSQKCLTFTYGGCDGNGNNFKTEADCVQVCGGIVATEAPTTTSARPTTMTTTTTTAPTTTETRQPKPEKSSLAMSGVNPVQVGTAIRIKCDAVTTNDYSSRDMEWFKDGRTINTTDPSSRASATVRLSGYDMVGELVILNADRSDAGAYYCRSLPDGDFKMMALRIVEFISTTPTTPYPEGFYTTATPRLTQPKDVCKLKMKVGTCFASIPKWYYDHRDGVCREFIYGGCDGNENNFDSKEECDKFCEPEEICTLRADTGPCRALIKSWAYDSSISKCREFIYGGCQGNPNNFGSKEACERRCKDDITEVTERNKCLLPRAGGSCDGYSILWYFDTSIKMCRRFIYTGCGGNANRFENKRDCEHACRGTPVEHETTTVPPATTSETIDNTCELRPDSARCPNSGNDPSDYKIKWYFDFERSLCTRFYFGGCGGNANRFDTRRDCQSRCVHGQRVTTTAVMIPTTTTPRPTRPTTPVDCRKTSHGCCKDGKTTAVDEYHSNCFDGPDVIERQYGDVVELLARPGRDIIINCQLDHSQHDIVTWYRDRFLVKTNFRYKLYNNGSLLIQSMVPEDTGTYSCQVSGGNKVPQLKTYKLKVRVPLRILESPKVIKIAPGDNAFLHCQVLGHPSASITWMKDGRPVSTRGHYRAFDNGTLIIIRALDHDAGSYECKAENGVSDAATKTIELVITERVKAKLDPYKGKVVEGGTVRLRCSGSGHPAPTMHWERDGNEITSNNKIVISGNELVIHNAGIEDSGMYTCVVKNAFEESRDVTIVQVSMQKMPDNCEDTLPMMKCKMIMAARLCGHRRFAKMCCSTCRPHHERRHHRRHRHHGRPSRFL